MTPTPVALFALSPNLFFILHLSPISLEWVGFYHCVFLMHKQHANPWLSYVVIWLLLLLIRWIWSQRSGTPLLPGDSNVVSPSDEWVTSWAQVPGEEIPLEPQPPQVPLAIVSEVTSLPDNATDYLGVEYMIQWTPKGEWMLDAVTEPQKWQLTFLSWIIATEGEFVLWGTLAWTLEGLTEMPLVLTIESYADTNLVGWLKWGEVSRKVKLPMQITFTDRMLILNSAFAMTYEPWWVVKKEWPQSEFISYKWSLVLDTKK